MTITKTLIALATAALIAAPGMKGNWNGSWKTASSTGGLWLKVDSTTAGWTVQIKSESDRQANPQFQPAEGVRVKGDSISFTVTWGTPVAFVGTIKDGRGTGTVVAQYWSGTWSVARNTAEQ